MAEQDIHSISQTGRMREEIVFSQDALAFPTQNECVAALIPDKKGDGGDVFLKKRRLRENIKLSSVFKEIRNRGVRLAATYQARGKGVQVLMEPQVYEAFQDAFAALYDVMNLDEFTPPDLGDELHSFIAQLVIARKTQEPLHVVTPICPDWSRNEDGQYDSKSLGDEASFIAEKFLTEGQGILHVLQRHNIPFVGSLVFANYGSEKRIEVEDDFTEEEVAMRFAASIAKTTEALAKHQGKDKAGVLASHHVIPMTHFFMEQQIDPDQLVSQFSSQLTSTKQGQRLVELMHAVDYPRNRGRGVPEDESRLRSINMLSEYATFGHACGSNAIIIAAEGRTASRAYNLFQDRKAPVLFLGGKSRRTQAVN